MERTIGATELRQRLTDVLHAVREERAAYIIETFEREQAALINLEEYRQFRQYMAEREAFFPGSYYREDGPGPTFNQIFLSPYRGE